MRPCGAYRWRELAVPLLETGRRFVHSDRMPRLRRFGFMRAANPQIVAPRRHSNQRSNITHCRYYETCAPDASSYATRLTSNTDTLAGQAARRAVEHAEECITGRAAIRTRPRGCRVYGGETTGSGSGTSERRPHAARRRGVAPCRAAARCRSRLPPQIVAPSP